MREKPTKLSLLVSLLFGLVAAGLFTGRAIAEECVRGGCGVGGCIDQSEVGTFRCPEYFDPTWPAQSDCYLRYSRCERQPNGQCGLTQFPGLQQCLAQATGRTIEIIPATPPPGGPSVRVEAPPSGPVHDAQIQVRCTANPHSIAAGGRVTISVVAFMKPAGSSATYPVPGADVRIESGGGWFARSGSTAEAGQAGPSGVFRTFWTSPNPAARAYVMDVTVTKAGFIDGKAACTVPIR